MSQDVPSKGRGLGERLTTFAVKLVRVGLRLLFVAVVGVGLGLGAYLGVPALYRSFVEPVRLGAEKTAELEARIEQQAANMQEQTGQIADRLAAVEGRAATLGEGLEEAKAELQALATKQGDQQDQLDKLDDALAGLDAVGDRLEALESRLASLEDTVVGEGAPTQELAREIQLVKAMEILTRARLWMIENNLGLAREDLTTAKAVLEKVSEGTPEEDQGVYKEIIDRLDLALADLQTAPVIAADDVEVAWTLLLAATEP